MVPIVAEMPAEVRKKMLPLLRKILNLELRENEDWRSIWLEGEQDSVDRQKKFFLSRGHSFSRVRPLDGAQRLKHPKPVYGNFDRLALHLLYDIFEIAGLTAANHTLLRFFAKADIEQRSEYIKLVGQKGRRADHVGRRWLAPHAKARVSIPVDPMACVELLESDLERVDAPASIKDANLVLRLNGKRPMSIIHASAYGWVIKGMGNACGCRNKRGGDDVTIASFIMPDSVRVNLIKRLEAEPSPSRPGCSVYDDVMLCSDALRSANSEEVEAAADFLRQVPIFPRPSAPSLLSAFLTYEGLNYWTLKGRKARHAAGERKPLQFSDGRREPTLRDYRRASITADVLELFARTSKGSKERAAGLLEIAARHDQSTDQSKAYAKWAYAVEHEREMLIRSEVNAKRLNEYQNVIRSAVSAPQRVQAELDHLAGRGSRSAK
jgi:hypothetical protein